MLISRCFPLISVLALLFSPGLSAQSSASSDSSQTQTAVSTSPKPAPPVAGQPATDAASSSHDKAAEQLKKQVHQRILGIVPNFNVSYLQDAETLSPSQKFHLAFRSAVDPFAFAVAGIDAGLSQASNDFPGYGQGAQGYAKRFAASYTDSFDGVMLGGAVFPVLLHQDPRYFRKGTGSFGSRLLYAISTTVRAKGDNRKWQPNYSNILGNIAAGGISNLYYPSSDRGVGLTFQRAFTVTAEGAIGSVFVEFWPDISHRLFHAK